MLAAPHKINPTNATKNQHRQSHFSTTAIYTNVQTNSHNLLLQGIQLDPWILKMSIHSQLMSTETFI
jgi:hypothetical protein